jgi:hypothetical protein
VDENARLKDVKKIEDIRTFGMISFKFFDECNSLALSVEIN